MTDEAAILDAHLVFADLVSTLRRCHGRWRAAALPADLLIELHRGAKVATQLDAAATGALFRALEEGQNACWWRSESFAHRVHALELAIGLEARIHAELEGCDQPWRPWEASGQTARRGGTTRQSYTSNVSAG